ncbi:hypothetical protein B0H16DRAFT_1854685 [Mycena metata]|uniref:Uncharacterized protein n=1 Tax=Mycena metata TaxID=1033252 RepID=A0AAD7IM63_9AGAR|nr:hypothetical protein B0H16DRAFT_1854685 [Mycena metata]
MSCHSSSSSISSPTFQSPFTSRSGSAPTSSTSEFSFTDLGAEGPGHACTLAIVNLPEPELRTLLATLATKPGFQRAIARQLHHSKTGKEPQTYPSAPPDAICANCQHTCRDTAADGPCCFHPGHLEERVFEFFSRTPKGHPLTIRRTLAMWTCCAEDYQTIGCSEAKAHFWWAA